MYCSECGSELPSTAKFCMECGTPTSLGPQESTQSQSTQTDNYIELAEAALQKQGWKESDEYYRKVLEVQPGNAQAWVGRTLAALGKRNVDELLETYLRTVYTDEDGYSVAPRIVVREIVPTFVEKALRADPNMPEAKIIMGYLYNEPSQIENLLEISDVYSGASLALKLLAIRYLDFCLTTNRESFRRGLFGKGHHEYYRVYRKDWLRKALAIPVVRGRVSMDEILSWRFPFEYETYIDDSSYSTDERPAYLEERPFDRLAKYLSSSLDLREKVARKELGHASDFHPEYR